MVFGSDQAQAGAQVFLFTDLGACALQGTQVLVCFATVEVALDFHRAAAEQMSNLAGVGFKQVGDILANLFEGMAGHELAGKDYLEAGVIHARVLVG